LAASSSLSWLLLVLVLLLSWSLVCAQLNEVPFAAACDGGVAMVVSSDDRLPSAAIETATAPFDPLWKMALAP
jgi:hypothetical protein